MKDLESLASAAFAAQKNAYAPYSKFQVGAALLTKSGHMYSGANLENASYGLTVCAERIAVGQAITAGERQFAIMVIATSSSPPAAPCGACRQVLHEFAPDLELVCVNANGESRRFGLRSLLPEGFTKTQLEDAT